MAIPIENYFFVCLLQERENLRARCRDWKRRNREKVRRYEAQWSAANRDRKRAIRTRSYRKHRRDPHFVVAHACRNRIGKALRLPGATHRNSIELLTGGVENLRSHISAKLQPGWTWENYGTVWEIDHIKPIAKFDLAQETERLAAFHFSNCQPLTLAENRSKKDQY